MPMIAKCPPNGPDVRHSWTHGRQRVTVTAVACELMLDSVPPAKAQLPKAKAEGLLEWCVLPHLTHLQTHLQTHCDATAPVFLPLWVACHLR